MTEPRAFCTLAGILTLTCDLSTSPHLSIIHAPSSPSSHTGKTHVNTAPGSPTFKIFLIIYFVHIGGGGYICNHRVQVEVRVVTSLFLPLCGSQG